MTIFVDDMQAPYGRMKMCHLWTNGLIEELFKFVDLIGVQRKWLQEPPRASWVHFDIALSKRALAIRHGAIQTDKYGPSAHVSRLRLNSEDPKIQAAGARMLRMIAEIRVRETKDRVLL
jgi:hypothetical protein